MKSVVIGCIDRAPNTNIDVFIEKINVYLDKLNQTNKLLYIMGDFNINLLNVDTHEQSGNFVESMFSYNLYPLITKPSTITPSTATLIDNIFCNSIESTFNSGLIIADVSDHFPIFCIRKLGRRTLQKNTNICSRLINDENIVKFKNRLREVTWSSMYENDNIDVNLCYDHFMLKFSLIYNECFPLVKQKSQHKCKFKKPWITSGLLKSIQKKHRLYKNFLKKTM